MLNINIEDERLGLWYLKKKSKKRAKAKAKQKKKKDKRIAAKRPSGPSKASQRKADKATKKASRKAATLRLSGKSGLSSTQIKAKKAAAAPSKPSARPSRPATGSSTPARQRAASPPSAIAAETKAQFAAFKAREAAKETTKALKAFDARIKAQKAAIVEAKKTERSFALFNANVAKQRADIAKRKGSFRPTTRVTASFEDDAGPDLGGPARRVDVPTSTRGKAGLALMSLGSATSALDTAKKVGRAIFRPRDEGRGRQSLGTVVPRPLGGSVAGTVVEEETGISVRQGKFIAKATEAQREQAANLARTLRVSGRSAEELRQTRLRIGKTLGIATEFSSLRPDREVLTPVPSTAKRALIAAEGLSLVLPGGAVTAPLKIGGRLVARPIISAVVARAAPLVTKALARERVITVGLRSGKGAFQSAAQRARELGSSTIRVTAPVVTRTTASAGRAATVAAKPFRAAGEGFFSTVTSVPKVIRTTGQTIRGLSKATDEIGDLAAARARIAAQKVIKTPTRPTTRPTSTADEALEFLKSTRGQRVSDVVKSGKGVKESPAEAAASAARRARIAAEEAARGSASSAPKPKPKPFSFRNPFANVPKPKPSTFIKPIPRITKPIITIARPVIRTGGRVTGGILRSPLGILGGGLGAVVGGGLILQGLKGPGAPPPQQAPAPAAPAAPPDTRRRQSQQQQQPAQAAQPIPAAAQILRPKSITSPVTTPSRVVIDSGATPAPSRTPTPTATPSGVTQTITVPTIGPDGSPIIDPTTGLVITTEVDVVAAPVIKSEPDAGPLPAIVPLVAAAAGIATGLLSRGRGGATSSQSFFGGSSSFIGPTIFRTAEGQTGIRIVKDGKGTITLEVERIPVKRFTILGRPLVKRPTRILGTVVQSKSIQSAGQLLASPPTVGSTTVIAGRAIQGRLN